MGNVCSAKHNAVAPDRIASLYIQVKSPLTITSDLGFHNNFVSMTNDFLFEPVYQAHPNLDGYSEVIFADDDEIESVAPLCDAALYFTSLIEGEGMDRSDIRLPGVTKAKQKNENAIIVGSNEFDLKTNQEESIQKMCRSNKNSAVKETVLKIKAKGFLSDIGKAFL